MGDGRLFFLTDRELIEGSIEGGRIIEVQRLSIVTGLRGR